MNQIHGHDVLNMMLASGKTYTQATLVADIIGKFGSATKFHTCSAEDMTAEELVTFLESRGKFKLHDGGFQTSKDVICQH
ncbi:MAG: YecH family metal-binding protein [Verrucomicrobiota bacterium]|jgi:probable metal-binding protein